MQVETGQQVSHYRLIRKIGEGGMGVVWKAEDLTLRRPVAIKFLPADSISDEYRRKMFFDEACLASRLSQSNIAQVYEFGEEDEQRFIVMEFVDGEPLARRLRNEPLETEFVVELGYQISHALSRVHREGLIHRDLKPSNILVTPEGDAKIVDFGLATFLHDEIVQSEITEVVTLSRVSQEDLITDGLESVGNIVGTIPYMSPEQARGKILDKRSDIFSMGIVLYEMTTGRRPFAAKDNAELVQAIIEARPTPVHDLVPHVPLELDRIVHKALAAKPAERYQTMEDMAVDLKRLGKDLDSGSSPGYETAVGLKQAIDSGIRQRPVTPGMYPKWALLAGVLAVSIVAVSSAAFLAAGWFREHRLTSSSIALASETTQYELRQLTFSGSAGNPLWSPNGDIIAYMDHREHRVEVIDVRGGTPRTLDFELPSRYLPWNWDRDGTGILAHFRDPETNIPKVVRLDLFGGAPRVLVENGAWGAHLHPDGDLLAYSHRLPGVAELGIWTRDLQSGVERQIVAVKEKGTAAYKPQWSPSGDELAFIRWNGWGHELWACAASGGKERKIDVRPVNIGGHYEWTPDGEAVVIAGSMGDLWGIWRVSMKGQGLKQLSQGWEYAYHTTISPDGGSVAFGMRKDRGRIGVLAVESAELLEPVGMSVATRRGRISPDGRNLVFQALINGLWQLWVADLEGEFEPHVIGKPGQYSSFSLSLSGEGDIFHIRSDMRPPTIFGKVAWSQQLWRTSLDGGRHEEIPGVGNRVSRLGPVGIRDGRLLYAAFKEDSGGERLCIMDSAGKNHEVMRSTSEEILGYFDWWHDEKQVIASLWMPGKGFYLQVLNPEDGTRQELTLHAPGAADSAEKRLILAGPISMSPGRDQLAVIAKQPGALHNAVYIHELKEGTTRRFYDLKPGCNPDSLAWSPDGKYVIMDVGGAESDIYILGGLDTIS